MTKLKNTALSLAAATAIALTGCGSDDGGTTNPPIENQPVDENKTSITLANEITTDTTLTA
ncbi:MAG: hypothetical protein U9O86_06930, partial [Campylobacterota bacterium]|nr:hypothetical protein [Campylobacterota bacterium]